MKRIITLLFAISVALTVYANLNHLAEIRLIAKPLIMVFVAWLYTLNTVDLIEKTNKTVLLAFLFSWIGDIALLFADDSSKAPGFYFFITGLVSFLTAHLLYITVFRKIAATSPASDIPITKRILMLVPVGFIAAVLIFFIIPHLGPMLIPVSVYAIVISLMTISAIALYNKVFMANFNLIYAGAVFFMISDMTLAFNQFVSPKPILGVIVMITYGAAQYSIMRGLSKVSLMTARQLV
ncbi:lysoplasmalogenase [Solitalea canadensis]|uniref:Putative membrane protein n=1 Tax=Solitalea canadensis (strain ATCC 29591 / DSM 3403 / JCM 21819 / LMG 8368 / NBRC 15130 / NCIMB 12057 / USAM 9D) TaxID=929556 RepID=H8KP25_SOLCM|nr:lysoplasmalogenase [Solitalea canadensis]AFD05547.1 putative membrane protein [Solitalea canadensis DSM 3403]